MEASRRVRRPKRGRPLAALSALEATLHSRGAAAAKRKTALIGSLANCTLSRPSHVARLHEALCFLRAYPDSPEVLDAVVQLLTTFADREDLQRHRSALSDTGIVGTPTEFAFFWPMAAWLSKRWPTALTIDWDRVDCSDRLERLLQLLVVYAETPALDTQTATPSEWFAELKGSNETDAQFLIERLRRLQVSERVREATFDQLDVPMRLGPNTLTPSRTLAYLDDGSRSFQTRPIARRKASLRRAIKGPPPKVRTASPRQGQAMVDLARGAMLTRSRDLDAISYGNPEDAYLIHSGDGLCFACFGILPERRLMLESVYVFMILKNGVPVGYFQAATLFGASELNFNIFDPWRGAESAAIYAKAVAMVHHVFESDVFAIDPYQIGDGNAEALRTGAFWFYYKLGFRPLDADVRRIAREEMAEIRRGQGHRTSIATLKRMAVDYLYFYVDGQRDDVVGRVSYGDIALSVSHFISERFGADREAATADCSRTAAQLLGVDGLGDLSPDERRAWERWSPLVVCLDGVENWSARDKRSLFAVIRAKGGRRELTYVRRCLRHGRLRKALLALGRP